jgi:hypothetical protein
MDISKKYYGCFDPLPDRSSKPTAIIIHHTCTSTPRETRSALKKKGYSTHFEVDKDGSIYQYVDVMKIASHCQGVNSRVIGIDATHEKNKPFPEVQIKALQELVSWLCRELDIEQVVHTELKGIWPHSAINVTVCPNGLPVERLGITDLETVEAIGVLFSEALKEGKREALKKLIADFDL